MNQLHITTALTLATLLAASAGAQQEPASPQRFGEELEVTEVLMDVLVTDARGNVVIGLQPEDFLVTERGRTVPVTAATFYSNRRFTESSAMAERIGVRQDVVPANRFFILFFQDDRAANPRLAGQHLDAARYTREWIDRSLLRNDYVAVVSYDVRLKVWTDFTNDRDDIKEAVDKVLDGRKFLENWPSRIDRDREIPSLLANLPQGKELRRQSRRIYDGLRLVAEAVGDVVGRKNLLFFSIGFGEGREFGVWTPDVRYYSGMMEALNENNVAVYSIDLIPTTKQVTIQDRIINQSLSALADDTGGRYYFHFNSFLTPLQQVADENNGYYLLSFRSENPAGASGYREVEIRTTNPDLQVRARKGYHYGRG